MATAMCTTCSSGRAMSAGRRPSRRPAITRCEAVANSHQQQVSRRQALGQAAALVALSAAAVSPAASLAANTIGQGADKVDNVLLCDAACISGLESKQSVEMASGLRYVDIVEGKGASPRVGFQAVVNYVALTPAGKVFDSSLDKGKPYDIRVGTGQVIPGLDEGLLSMKSGGVRRMYVPGSLAFPKGVKAAPGRPAVPPGTPVVFDVQLLYIPGLEDE